METCLICHEEFQKQSSFKCMSDQCNVYVCESCIHTWDIMYPRLECPLCHTSREKPDNDLILIIQSIRNRVVYSDYVSNNHIIYEIKNSYRR
jgi:hypothetical protein